MALDSSSAIHIQPVSISSTSNVSRPPTHVTIHPVALLSILDHYLRRTDDQPRVIGTLLGTRSSDGATVHVRSSFAVLHSENSEQVAVDMEYHRTMYELCSRVNPKELIVGWYSTGSNLNTYSALIQNFYSQETAPHHTIHVALNTAVEEGEEAGVKAYISSPVGVFPKPENCVFVPVPVDLQFSDSERAGLDLLPTDPIPSTPVTPPTPLASLHSTLLSVSAMLDRVLAYVHSVLRDEIPGDKAIGRYLMDTLGASEETRDEGEDGDSRGQEGFNASLQDTLMITYLANLVRSQAEVSARLALTTGTTS